MATDTEIEPVLTSEQWAKIRDREMDIHLLRDEQGDDIVVGLCRVGDGARHTLAALALHEQEYGFTHHDVARLRQVAAMHHVAAERASDVLATKGEHDIGGTLADLANRIAALLPPE